MRNSIAAMGALVAALALGSQARAATAFFDISGPGVSGQGSFTFAPDVSPPDPDTLCGTTGHNPCRHDPPGAYAITSIAGTLSDTAAGLTNAAITGLIPINPAPERDITFDPLVPTSLSFYDYAPGQAATYNNLFFPAGSPIDCDFPFFGTFVDVFGMAFTVAGGDVVNFWGDGNEGPGGTLTYGIKVIQGSTVLDGRFDGLNAKAVIPEPATWMLMIGGVFAMGLGLRSRRRAAAVV